MRRHALKHKKFKNIFHIDAYRLKTAKHLEALEFNRIVRGRENVVLIEWADRVKKILPKDAIWLHFRHGRRENERRIMIKQ